MAQAFALFTPRNTIHPRQGSPLPHLQTSKQLRIPIPVLRTAAKHTKLAIFTIHESIMPPIRGRKRKSDQSTISNDDYTAHEMASQTIPTKSGSPSGQESPRKKRKTNITLAQKQALIENLQLESASRSRLRYLWPDALANTHFQSLNALESFGQITTSTRKALERVSK